MADPHAKPGIIEQTAPLLPVAVGMLLGIVGDRFFRFAPVVYLLVFLLAGAGILLFTLGPVSRRFVSGGTLLRPMLLALAAASAGGMLHFNDARRVPPSSIEPYLTEARPLARVRGTVAGSPRVLGATGYDFRRWTYGQDRTAFLLKAESIEGVSGDIPVTGLIRVVVSEAVLDLREDERIEVVGKLYAFPPPRNPGSFDWRAYYRRQGVSGGIRCNHREGIIRLDDHPPPIRPSLIAHLRQTVRGLITDDLAAGADEEASLLQAMVLGHRSRLDRKLNDIFIRAGCIHFLAVSGVHVVIVMALARLACAFLGLRPRSRYVVLMIAVVGYMLIAEPRPPILRAGLIGLLYCVARLLGRERSHLNWISAAVVVLTLIAPTMVFDVGFQLSFVAVLGVSYLMPAIFEAGAALRSWFARTLSKRSLDEEGQQLLESLDGAQARLPDSTSWIWRSLGRRVFTALAVSTAAWLAAMPLVMVHFNRIQFWGAVNSLIVLPLVAVVMALGFAKLITTVVSPTVGALLAVPLAAVDSSLIRVVEQLARLPAASVGVAAPAWWWIALYYGFLISFALAFPRPRLDMETDSESALTKRPVWGKRARAVCAALFAGVMVATALSFWPVAPARGRLVVSVLDVGDGTCVVLQLPEGKTVLYDAGSLGPYDVGAGTLVPFLRHGGVRRVEAVYLSHANLDHFSGVPTLIEAISTGPVLLNEYFESHSTARTPGRKLLDVLEERGHTVKVLDPAERVWEMGGAVFERLWPLGSYDETLQTNETSTVLRVSFQGHSILLTGDIEDRAQRVMLDRGDLGADVLLLPHHGGVVSSTPAFIRAVGAAYVVRSSNQRTAETTSGLNEILEQRPPGPGRMPPPRLRNTADCGAVEITIDADGITVSPNHSEPPAPHG